MAEYVYRLSWESVNLAELWRYCDENPAYFKGTKQTVPNSRIPDEHWHTVSRETDSPFQQYEALKAWADEDREFIRNVVLERAVSDPQWEVVDPDPGE